MTTVRRDPKIPDLLSLTQAAKVLDLSKPYLSRRYVDTGILAGQDVGGTFVFRRVAVERLRDQRASHPSE